MRHVFDFNQALMDFGAMVCVARNPKCLVCPMAKSCRACPFDARAMTTIVVDRRGHRARRPVPRDAAPARRAPRGLLGVSRRQVRRRAKRSTRVWRASFAKSSTSRRASARKCSRRRMRIRIASGAAFLRVRTHRRAAAAARSGDALGRARGAGGAAVPAGRCGADCRLTRQSEIDA